jgi:hypothetical protein
LSGAAQRFEQDLLKPVAVHVHLEDRPKALIAEHDVLNSPLTKSALDARGLL